METNSKDIVTYFENYLEIHPQNTSTFSFRSSTQMPTTFVDETTSDKNIVVLSKKILKNNYETTKLSLSLDNEEINKNEENVKTEIEITKTGKSIIREIDEIEIINQYKSQKNKDIAREKEQSIEEIYFIELKRTYNIDV